MGFWSIITVLTVFGHAVRLNVYKRNNTAGAVQGNQLGFVGFLLMILTEENICNCYLCLMRTIK